MNNSCYDKFIFLQTFSVQARLQLIFKYQINPDATISGMTALNWIPKKPDWSADSYQLLLDYKIVAPPSQTVEDIITNSRNFPINFPVDTVRCQFLRSHVSDDILQRNINSAYPIIHHKALELFCQFILFKREYGSDLEKDFYAGMTLKGFIDRLLKKRAVSFLGVHDYFMLLDGVEGAGNWETIGTAEEKSPLILRDCLSYDEVKCSVFLNVSSYTYFVNKGDRRNYAKFVEDRSDIEGEDFLECYLSIYS